MIAAIELPYSKDALTPYISEQTVDFHYEKHHKGYVKKLNDALANGSEGFDKSSSVEDIIASGTGSLYDLAAQVWNHNFYWQCLQPYGGNSPSEKVLRILADGFGSFDKFVEEMKSAASSEFGSGWAWLVRDKEGKLKILSTTDAQNPLSQGMQPLLVVDVWEHAYYLDYKNDRGAYLDAVFAHLVNWAFLEENLTQTEPAQS